MEDIIRIANKYFMQTEDLKFWFSPHNKSTYFFTFLGPLFIYIFCSFYPKYKSLRGTALLTSPHYLTIIALGSVTVITWMNAIEKRNKILISIHFPNDRHKKSIKDVKIKILNKILDTNQSEYMKLSEKILFLHKQQKKMNNSFRFTAEYISSMIYNNESISRIITWIAILISLIAGIIIRSTQNYDELYQLFIDNTPQTILFVIFLMSISIGILIIIANALVVIIRHFIFRTSLVLDKEKSMNTYPIKYLLHDLIQYAMIVD